MRFLIMLEQTETGFAVQAPDLAISAYGENIEAAKRAASEAIRINLEAYREAGQPVPEGQSVSNHLENPEFRDLLFAYVEVAEPQGRIAALLNPARSSAAPAAASPTRRVVWLCPRRGSLPSPGPGS
jgi:predicted RNase H-like HicB family nuclease